MCLKSNRFLWIFNKNHIICLASWQRQYSAMAICVWTLRFFFHLFFFNALLVSFLFIFLTFFYLPSYILIVSLILFLVSTYFTSTMTMHSIAYTYSWFHIFHLSLSRTYCLFTEFLLFTSHFIYLFVLSCLHWMHCIFYVSEPVCMWLCVNVKSYFFFALSMFWSQNAMIWRFHRRFFSLFVCIMVHVLVHGFVVAVIWFNGLHVTPLLFMFRYHYHHWFVAPQVQMHRIKDRM